ncbi:MAG: murein biosynthesis integral membrane protein MurJ, partial [Candidatus Bipolaricaulota bacterium]|nr:murein biosynthesis integral membrane protein MurJ [Candidatus Bipolaricaulota bacterium]MDW8127407.1 murein biosynthesis integral membrane protein MurJ [Candidatus Bipolaricaulota bacterium]
MLLGRVLRAALGTGLSRLTGLARDVAIAYAFGASASYDAFLVGLFIPQALRQVIGEAGLASAFIPVYAKAAARGEDTAFARSFLRLLLFSLPPLALLGSLLARVYVPVLAAGFPQDKMEEAINLAGLLFPLIIFISLSAFQSAILNAHGSFLLPSLAPSLLNLGMIVGALFLSKLFRPPVLGLVVGTLGGGAATVLLLLPPFHKTLGPRSPAPLFHPDLREVGQRLVPCLAGLFVVEANTLVDNRLASYLPHGSIATLQYAMRLFQFPLGILAVSVATVALPALSENLARNDAEAFRRTLARCFLLAAAFMIPATFGLWLLAKPTVALLFERGAFRPSDTLRTAQNLCGYLVGLWAYALIYLFSRAFYALGRPALPLLGSFLALLVNIGLNLWWVRIWGTFGLALATGVAGWVGAVFLAVLLWRRIPGWIDWPRVFLVLLGSLS